MSKMKCFSLIFTRYPSHVSTVKFKVQYNKKVLVKLRFFLCQSLNLYTLNHHSTRPGRSFFRLTGSQSYFFVVASSVAAR